MATENNNTQINSFNKGMNTDGSYANIQQGYYLYAENLRNYALNKQKSGDNNNQYSTIQAVEGCKWNDTYKLCDFNGNPFKITKILAADTIRDIGVIIADNGKQWCVIRVQLNNESELTDPKIIYISGTGDKEQLHGDKVSIVLKFETDDNVKLYIADGHHFIMILNVASSNDEYNKKISGDTSKIEAQQSLFLHPIKFLGLTGGTLSAGVVQYAYRLYDQNGTASPMSCITNTIQIVQNKENNDSDIVKGGAKGDYLGCGVKLRITIDSYNNPVYNHIEIYRVFYEEGGQLPKVGVIYNKKIPNVINQATGVQNIDYTDFGQDYLSETTIDEFNNISGIHIIPKVLESKNGRLFAANIKDSESNLVDIANHFDARTFRFNADGKYKYSQYTDQNNSFEITRDEVDKFNNYDGSSDTNDYYNSYNDITKPTTLNEDGVGDDYKFGELWEGKYPLYGGYGKNIKWRFVLTELVGDYTNMGNPFGKRETDNLYLNVGAVGNTLLTQYEECSDKNTPMLYDNKLRYGYVAYDKENNKNIVLKQDDIDYKELFESSDKNMSYANSCISYGFRSLRRDELYRFGIVLYNKRNEATPVLWIGDIRTPSCNESGFDTYESNSQNSALVVRPLGIQFSVDLTSINEYIENNDEYTDLDKIQAYEIVRCYRSSNDVQNIAQGVLSRPIKKVKNPNSSVTIDPVYTPTGILTTAAYWNGECWAAHNDAFVDKYGLGSDEVKNLNEYEADNFDNSTLFQFICPEVCYNKEYISTIIQKQNMYLQPVYYVFGAGKGRQHNTDTCFEYCHSNNQTSLDNPAFSKFSAIENYSYASTSWSNNQQPLPPVISSEDIIGGKYNKDEENSFHKFGLDEGGTMPVDLFIAKKQVGGFIKTPEKLILYSKQYTEDGDGNKNYKFLDNNQLFFIYDSYGRSMINYFENKACTRNGYDIMIGAGVYTNDTKKNYGFRYSTSGNDYLTYKTPSKNKQGAASCTTLGIIAQPQYKSYMNCIQYAYGYSKLYEKSCSVILRDKTSPLDIEPVKGTIDVIGSGIKYKIKDATVTQTLNWDDIFSGDTKDGKTTYSYKYNDYVQPIGIYSYCNVVAGGKYGEPVYLSTDKIDGLFNSDGYTKISYGDMPSGLLGTAGSSILVNLESADNILCRSIATTSILKHNSENTSLSDVVYWEAENYETKPSGDSVFEFENSPVNEEIIERTKDHSRMYDLVYYYKDNKPSLVHIYRSSIAGTYLCNLRQNIIPYGGYQYTSRISNTYVSCGNYYKDDQKGNTKIIFNGDCYIQPFEYVSAHKYYYKDVKSPVTTCLVYTFPVETNINIIASHGSEFSKIIDSDGLCTNIQQQPSNVNDIYSQDKPEYVYNSVYSQQSNAQTHQTVDMSSDSNTLKKVDYRCHYSELKSNNENIDSWQVFKPANFLDVDDKYGEITHLRAFNNKLIFWQEHAVGEFSVNERSQISDDSGKPLVLGVGDVLTRYDYYDRTTGMHKEQYCNTCSNSVLYWFDSHNDEIKALSSNGIIQLNKMHGTQNIMHERKGVQHPKMFYDKKYNELVSKVLHTSTDQSLSYNEMIQEFTSVYDINFDESLTFDDNTYLLNSVDDGIKIGHWNYGDGMKNTVLKYVVNESPMTTKVFDNQEIVTEQQFVPKKPMFYGCEFSWATELFNQKVTTKPIITDREGNFRYSLPRVGNAKYGNRLRGKYMIGEIYNISTTPISYIITKFRRSCS